MDSEANKAIVRRYIEMWNTGEVALDDEVVAATHVDHAHPEVSGPERVKQALLEFRAAFPDFRITIESLISEGDMVALLATLRRTHQGKEAASRVMWFIRLANAQIVELLTRSEIPR